MLMSTLASTQLALSASITIKYSVPAEAVNTTWAEYALSYK